MSALWARTYDYPVAVSPSDTIDDPAGPFAGLLITTGGTLSFVPRSGPNGIGAGTPITIDVAAGLELHFPVRRIMASNTTCGVLGLASSIVR